MNSNFSSQANFFFNDTATTEIYTLSLHERSSDLPFAGSNMRAARSASRAGCACCVAFCVRSEEHTSELQSQSNLVCRLLLEKKDDRELRAEFEAEFRLIG